MRKKITPLQRARQAASRVNALQAVASYGRKIGAKRAASVKAALSELRRRGVPPAQWAVEVQYTEPWMYPLLTDLYRTAGMLSATEVANRLLSRKEEPTDIFARAILAWTQDHLGERISLMTDTVNEWLRQTLATIYAGEAVISVAGVPTIVAASTLGVEALTKLMYQQTLAQYDTIRKWQVRRIVQTETMHAMNISGLTAADALGIDYEKTWSIAGINTRETHEAVDGITLGKGELFTVGGWPMERPMDERYGAPAGEVINCSCTLIFLPRDNGIDAI